MKNIIAAFLMLLIAGCAKENSDFTDMPVLQSYLQPSDYFSLTVSRQAPFSSDVEYSADSVNSLAITLVYNGMERVLTPIGGGKYIDSTIVMSALDSFEVIFSFNSSIVQTSTSIPSKPAGFLSSDTLMLIPPTGGNQMGPSSNEIAPIILAWDNSDASYYLLLVTMIDPNPLPIDTSGEVRPPKSFRKPPTIYSSEELRSGDFQYYGLYQVVLYHVHTDYAALYAQNSNTSLNLTNPSSNITNGYGIFTGINSDTTYIKIAKP